MHFNDSLIFYLASLLYFFADVLQKKFSANRATWEFVFIRSIYTTAIAWLICLFVQDLNELPSLYKIGEIMGASIFSCLGFYFYIKAINTTNFSNTWSLGIIGTVFQLLIGVFLFNETFKAIWTPAIILMCTGNIIQITQSKAFEGAKFVLLSVLFWSIGNAALSKVLQGVEALWSVPIIESSILLMSGMVVLTSKSFTSHNRQNSKRNSFSLLLVGVFIFVGSYWSQLSLQKIPISRFSILQLSMLPIGYLLSFKIFKEKPSSIEWVSFITGCIGFTWYVFNK
jgi:drug/metabolite transporter (DMT)-like permease